MRFQIQFPVAVCREEAATRATVRCMVTIAIDAQDAAEAGAVFTRAFQLAIENGLQAIEHREAKTLPPPPGG